MAAPAGLDDAFLRDLLARYEAQDPGTAAARLQALVDSVNALKADVAVVGRRGAGVTTLIHALVGERPGLEDPQAFFQQAPEPPGQPAGYTHPAYPTLALWDLPGFQEPEKPGDYTKRLGGPGEVRLPGAGGGRGKPGRCPPAAPQGLPAEAEALLRGAHQGGPGLAHGQEAVPGPVQLGRGAGPGPEGGGRGAGQERAGDQQGFPGLGPGDGQVPVQPVPGQAGGGDNPAEEGP
ncbi:unnamed protein product [Eretmochelys imbricata]